MIEKKNVPIEKISWLSSSYGKCASGIISNFYEAENIQELEALCTEIYSQNKVFDLIGSTSNIYFRPDYNSEIVISTRKCREWNLGDDFIRCDCGVQVSKLAREMVNLGYKGFEGLVDLPGTVAASLYGNAGCFDCSISDLLIDAQVLLSDGNHVTMTAADFCFTKRSSIFKRGEKKGVILSARLKLVVGDKLSLRRIAENNQLARKAEQSGPLNNLGSVFVNCNSTFSFKTLRVIGKLYTIILTTFGYNQKDAEQKKMWLLLKILGEVELHPYLEGWNRYVWKDEKAHALFYKYISLYKRLYKNAKLEIEIKTNDNSKGF